MSLGELGAVLVVLVAAVALGNLWFHTVEAVLERIKRRFKGRREEPWHTLPPEQEEKQDV